MREYIVCDCGQPADLVDSTEYKVAPDRVVVAKKFICRAGHHITKVQKAGNEKEEK